MKEKELTLEKAKEIIEELKSQLAEYESLFLYIQTLKTKQDFLDFRKKVLEANKRIGEK